MYIELTTTIENAATHTMTIYEVLFTHNYYNDEWGILYNVIIKSCDQSHD